jgi:hypothetical protein
MKFPVAALVGESGGSVKALPRDVSRETSAAIVDSDAFSGARGLVFR